DKPIGMSSTQAVGKVRWLYGAQKAGHAGTLDPLASGILPIALGEATKTVPFLVEATKDYQVTLKWGERTSTLDAEGDIVALSDVRPTPSQLQAVLPAFIGEITQIPPAFSAIKIGGERAYDLARAGKSPEMRARTVTIDQINILETTKDSATLLVKCHKGTYIRSLARDIAHKLGTEASVSALKRLRVGPFALNDAFSLDALEELRNKGRVLDALLGVKTALDDIPALAITENERGDLKLGRAISLHPAKMAELRPAFQPRMIGDLDVSRYVLAIFEDEVVALCDARAGRLSPKRVFNM
ncbi:MAG TPA: tRNA pseudouridine(55) synthase TruB, partial [Hellea balneolensis]|nr:tRNA pseudouridine(55) synthase TruB [Hellea balneolensis]